MECFAFALWDEEEQKLFCLRDQFGTKPFYYYRTEDNRLLTGTTIRGIMAQPGFKKELNEEMLQLYLSLTYVAGENTFFKGLKKLLPGRYLIWQKGELQISVTGNRSSIRTRPGVWRSGPTRSTVHCRRL